MIVYLAYGKDKLDLSELSGADVLYSFYYAQNDAGFCNIIPTIRSFLLDSGVFSFLNSNKKFDTEFVYRYAQFVKENNIRNYIELDVDQIVGVKETRKIRDKLESLVGWQSIPVWHTIRGKESFERDCKDYDYIALGYFITEGIKKSVCEKYAPYFIDKAHENGCKIHGLGYTDIRKLDNMHFDSVDSSTWMSALYRGGTICVFDKRKHIINKRKIENSRINLTREAYAFSFQQWRLYQDWARINLKTINK